MLLLASAGVSVREYRSMTPALADALAERAAEHRRAAHEGTSETLKVVLELLMKRLVAIESAIARRPFGV